MAPGHHPRQPAWPPKSAPRLFVEQVLEQGARVMVEGSQAHYLARVMRVAPGDGVVLCDDATGEWAARVETAGRREVMLEVAWQMRSREEVPDFWLCPALLKKDRFDLVLEKATELGAAQIRPVIMRRCVADRLNLERARAITIEAAEQCARTALPVLSGPVSLASLIKGWDPGRALFFADENGGEAAITAFAGEQGSAALLIGPEGGIDPDERELLIAHPRARAISLGPRILRGETAAIAGLAIWMAQRGDWAG